MSKKAQERIYFKNRELVEQFKVKHPDAVLTRFIKNESDLDKEEWLGYSVDEEPKAPQSNEANQNNVPTIA